MTAINNFTNDDLFAFGNKVSYLDVVMAEKDDDGNRHLRIEFNERHWRSPQRFVEFTENGDNLTIKSGYSKIMFSKKTQKKEDRILIRVEFCDGVLDYVVWKENRLPVLYEDGIKNTCGVYSQDDVKELIEICKRKRETEYTVHEEFDMDYDYYGGGGCVHYYDVYRHADGSSFMPNDEFLAQEKLEDEKFDKARAQKFERVHTRLLKEGRKRVSELRGIPAHQMWWPKRPDTVWRLLDVRNNNASSDSVFFSHFDPTPLRLHETELVLDDLRSFETFRKFVGVFIWENSLQKLETQHYILWDALCKADEPSTVPVPHQQPNLQQPILKVEEWIALPVIDHKPQLYNPVYSPKEMFVTDVPMTKKQAKRLVSVLNATPPTNRSWCVRQLTRRTRLNGLVSRVIDINVLES